LDFLLCLSAAPPKTDARKLLSATMMLCHDVVMVVMMMLCVVCDRPKGIFLAFNLCGK
jgi:hypothetical protein